jgi:hypothetical protein
MVCVDSYSELVQNARYRADILPDRTPPCGGPKAGKPAWRPRRRAGRGEPLTQFDANLLARLGHEIVIQLDGDPTSFLLELHAFSLAIYSHLAHGVITVSYTHLTLPTTPYV